MACGRALISSLMHVSVQFTPWYQLVTTVTTSFSIKAFIFHAFLDTTSDFPVTTPLGWYRCRYQKRHQFSATGDKVVTTFSINFSMVAPPGAKWYQLVTSSDKMVLSGTST